MKFKDKYDVSPEFEGLFSFASEDDQIEHEAKMIMTRFFSELEKIIGDKPLKKKEIAKAIKTSPSYVTQLFRGDKLVNLTTLAKIEMAYNITFEIKAKLKSEDYSQEVVSRHSHAIPVSMVAGHNGRLWLSSSKKPVYTGLQKGKIANNPKLKIA